MNGDLYTNQVGSNTFNCDAQWENCSTNDIDEVYVIDDTTTRIRFLKDPGLEDGDVITMSDNLHCVEGGTCTPEKLSMMKGEYEFADMSTNDQRAPDQYFIGHKVTRIAGSVREYTINIGFPDECYIASSGLPGVIGTDCIARSGILEEVMDYRTYCCAIARKTYCCATAKPRG